MRKRSPGFFVGFSALLLVMLAVLELNKNMIAGWLLCLAAACVYVLLCGRTERRALRALLLVGWIAAFALILFLTRPPVKYVPAVEGKDPARSETVLTRKGEVQGVVTADGAVEVFAGIPYAKAPTGELRWRALELARHADLRSLSGHEHAADQSADL